LFGQQQSSETELNIESALWRPKSQSSNRMMLYVMLVPFMRNSPHDAYLESGYSFALVSANIISDHFFDFYSYGTIQL